ncbi:hypothetical protein [Bacillus sp. ISL-37]|uniref:hypothetical protein n=1 Tax=Bacillus sp. ISL-37 TaxID=2819123 RepID=UPI001BE71A7D|nr:hypothetical protein [Bacillus sp. ISL-37]MBT2686189.1 hypothetical protein [Bacillus sp. ISL-37]
MKILSTTKGKVMAGALALAVIGGGAAGASNFGFIDQLSNILSGANDKIATFAAGEVDKSDEQYQDKIIEDVNAAAGSYANEMAAQATKEMNRGKGEVKSHYDDLKADLDSTVNTSKANGTALITSKVNAQVLSSQAAIESAAVDAINAQLQKDSITKYVSGGQVVNR